MSGSEAAREEEMLLDVDLLCVSRLPLGDLAGSEVSHCPHNQGDELKEVGNINQSLIPSLC